MRRLIPLLVLLTALLHGVARGASGEAAALFERDWEWQLQQAPEYATTIGDPRFNARLSDASLAASRAAYDHARKALDDARALDRDKLGAQERLSLDLFVFDKERQLARFAFHPFDPQPITAWDGLHVRFPRLVAQMPFATEEDYRNYIARLDALPAHVDGLIEQLREGMRTGWTAPKASVRAVPDQLRAMRERLADGPVSAPLRRIPATIDAAVREELLKTGSAALERSAAPALRKLEDFIRQDYLPAARESLAASSLPGGPGYYAFLVRGATGSELTPAEVHALGLKEVARIRAAMEQTVARTGFRGTLAQFLVFARSDKRLFANNPDSLLARYRRTIARAEARLPDLFGTIPDAGIGVKPLGQPGAAGQVAAYYEAGTPQRSAALVVNTARPQPLWEVETLALHEGLPGHHLQVARAQALANLPPFRRHRWDDAFGEGWATYAESLGPELGFFKDPFSGFGYLNDEMFRAARLVVDTGLHAQGWSRRQAIDYLNANTANAAADNEVEVDRYIAQPAQALSYKIGQLRFKALREKAQAALGPRFDLRRFHDALLGKGSLPLPLLEREMERWLGARLAPPPPGPGPFPLTAPPVPPAGPGPFILPAPPAQPATPAVPAPAAGSASPGPFPVPARTAPASNPAAPDVPSVQPAPASKPAAKPDAAPAAPAAPRANKTPSKPASGAPSALPGETPADAGPAPAAPAD